MSLALRGAGWVAKRTRSLLRDGPLESVRCLDLLSHWFEFPHGLILWGSYCKLAPPQTFFQQRIWLKNPSQIVQRLAPDIQKTKVDREKTCPIVLCPPGYCLGRRSACTWCHSGVAGCPGAPAGAAAAWGRLPRGATHPTAELRVHLWEVSGGDGGPWCHGWCLFLKFFFFRYFPAIPEKRMTGQWFNMSICIKLCNIYIVHTHFSSIPRIPNKWFVEQTSWSVGRLVAPLQVLSAS